MHFKNSVLYKLLTGLILLFMSGLSYAANVVITGNKVITQPTIYKDVTLDLTQGEFTVTKNTTLSIVDSTVNVVISPTNPFFIMLEKGSLNLVNSTVNVSVSGISPTPNTQALYQLISVNQGTVAITGNKMSVDAFFTVGLLSTNPLFPTHQFNISNNAISNFHGGIYLNQSSNAEINNNSFMRVSNANIFNAGDLNEYTGNVFTFPGNLKAGDAIDIINSTGVSFNGNIISSSSNYGIFISGGKNLFIDNNKITDSLSHGIYIGASSTASKTNSKYFSFLAAHHQPITLPNSNITISNNYIALNRYGIASEASDVLKVIGNTFIQNFSDDAARKFWTDNGVLLSNVTNLTWTSNIYKEGFTQTNGGDNQLALQFVPFPAQGGVVLPIAN